MAEKKVTPKAPTESKAAEDKKTAAARLTKSKLARGRLTRRVSP